MVFPGTAGTGGFPCLVGFISGHPAGNFSPVYRLHDTVRLLSENRLLYHFMVNHPGGPILLLPRDEIKTSKYLPTYFLPEG